MSPNELEKRIGDKAWDEFKKDLHAKCDAINKSMPYNQCGLIYDFYRRVTGRKSGAEEIIRKQAVYEFIDSFNELQDRVEDIEGNLEY